MTKLHIDLFIRCGLYIIETFDSKSLYFFTISTLVVMKYQCADAHVVSSVLPAFRLESYIAIFPDLAKSSSLNSENHLI